MMNKYLLYFFILVVLFSVLINVSITNIALAAEIKFEDATGLKKTGEKIGFEDYGEEDTGQSIALIVGSIIQGVLVFIGIIFMVLILMGAFEIQGSGGNEEAIQKGKLKIKNGAVGMVIVLGAYLVSHLFLGWLTGGQTVFKISK